MLTIKCNVLEERGNQKVHLEINITNCTQLDAQGPLRLPELHW